jgi:hypothetical protein
MTATRTATAREMMATSTVRLQSVLAACRRGGSCESELCTESYPTKRRRQIVF